MSSTDWPAPGTRVFVAGDDATDPAEAPGTTDPDEARLVAQMLAQGLDPGPLLGRGERPGVRARLRRLFGLDPDAGPPVELEEALTGLDPDARLGLVEQLAAAGDPRVTGTVLAQARADVDVSRLRRRQVERQAAVAGTAADVERLDELARAVLVVLDDQDPDLQAATAAWADVVSAARRALAHAQDWNTRSHAAVGAFQHRRAFAGDISTPTIDEAAARATAASLFGATPEALAYALTCALDPAAAAAPIPSLWGRMPVPAA